MRCAETTRLGAWVAGEIEVASRLATAFWGLQSLVLRHPMARGFTMSNRSPQHQGWRRVAAFAGAGLILLILAGLVAPVSAAPSPGETRSGGLEVRAAVLAYQQSAPSRMPSAKWSLARSLALTVTDVPVGTKVDVRLIQPSSGTSSGYEVTVNRGGELWFSYGRQFNSLDIAMSRQSMFSGPATVEVRVTPDSAPLVAEIPQWDVLPPLQFRDVKMTRKDSTVTFTGRILTVSGKPVSDVSVGATLKGEGWRQIWWRSVAPKRNGSFVVSATRVDEPGRIGLQASVSVNGVRGFGTVYSQMFPFKP